jgi:D-alanyl-lipoteichoic acid acyltransferase DltB (MBOAT superfamily)
LGGSKGSIWIKIRNTFIIFLVSGFWHGANWTFIIWGFLNALYIMPSILFNTNRNNLEIVAKGKIFPTLKEFLSILFTFSLTVLAWIFFRATSVEQGFSYISKIVSKSFFSIPNVSDNSIFILLLLFIGIEWMGREQQYALARIMPNKPKVFRWAFYYLLIVIIFVFAGSNQQFIYFQF